MLTLCSEDGRRLGCIKYQRQLSPKALSKTEEDSQRDSQLGPPRKCLLKRKWWKYSTVYIQNRTKQ